MSRNSLEEKTPDEELIWIMPEAVMTSTRHGRLWFLSQPLNEPDQCCRSSTRVLNTSCVYCVFLCLLSAEIPVLFQRETWCQPKGTQGLGKGGCCRKEWRPKTHTATASWTHSLGCILSSMEALLFLPKGFFWTWTKQIILAMHYLHTGKQPGHTSVYGCIHC